MSFPIPPPIKLHGCLWTTREIITFHLHNYTLSTNKSIFTNAIISRFFGIWVRNLNKSIIMQTGEVPGQLQGRDGAFNGCNPLYLFLDFLSASPKIFYKCSLERLIVAPVINERATVLFFCTFYKSSSAHLTT